jgi:hypothetical protein
VAGQDCVNEEIVAKAPFTTCSGAPFAVRSVASERFKTGSNGTNVTSAGGSAIGLLADASRMAASTAS